MDSSTFEFRPLTTDEHPLALDLWGAVFDVGRAYFERYYDSDPLYIPGDTIGAWHGNLLVSAVHLCRRPVTWKHGSSLLCGGIANVGTLPEYRRLGLSRQLLTNLIARMESIGVHFSTLGTDVPGHYARLGWEPMEISSIELSIQSRGENVGNSRRHESDVIVLQSLYQATPRPFQLERPTAYFESWVDKYWRKSKGEKLVIPNKGYAIIISPLEGSGGGSISEFRAIDYDSELEVLSAAINAFGSFVKTVHMPALPQFVALTDLHMIETVAVKPKPGVMVRNVNLIADDYAAVSSAFVSGEAVWWPADAF